MSSVSIQGNASGTGVFTLASPNSNTNRTLTLPDATGTIITTAGGAAISGTTGAFTTTVGVGGATPAASGAGITFPATQSASSDANTLDDYEEGTWTPSVGGNATYSGRDGIYTKIGNIVTCQFNLGITTLGTGATIRLSGFPFTASTTQTGSISYYASIAVNTIFVAMYMESGVTTAQFVGKASSGSTVDNGIGIFGNGAVVYGQVTYRIA